MNVQVRLPGTEHWTSKGDVKLFLWNKVAGDPAKTSGTILFVHGSSMASQPTFDLDVPGRPDSSAMDWFARQGFDCWCVDMEGYGRSDKDRDNNCAISQRRRRLFAAATYIQKLRGAAPAARLRHLVGRAARRRCSPQRHPEMRRPPRARRVRLDRRRRADARRAAQEAARVPREEPPADRPRVRALDLQPRPSRHRRGARRSMRSPTRSSRSTTRCRPAPTSTCARSCRSSIRTKIKVPTLDHARPVRRHRGLRRPDRVLQAAAESRQAVRRDAGHLARELPAEELPDGLSHPASFFTQPAPVYRG